MWDVMCVGIGCLDVLIRGADVTAPFLGEAKNCEQVALEVGGDAVNQAIALRHLGVNAGLMTGLGTDATGGLILEQLKHNIHCTEWNLTDEERAKINEILVPFENMD